MNPLKLKLSNSLGIKAGLGRDSITLDLERTIPSDARMIAIRGDNGSGKSTIMKLGMHPWREPPFLRNGLYGEFDQGKGLRELEFDHEGNRYRSEITINQTEKTKTTKAYLYRLDGDKETPYSMPDGTVSDGKGSTYDKCLAHLLGPQELYFQSTYRAQGADKLAEIDNPKEFMGQLLNLGHLAVKRQLAMDVARELSRDIDSLRAGLDHLSTLEERAVESDSAAHRLSEEIPSLQARVRSAQQTVDTRRRELTEAESGMADLQRLREQRRHAESEIRAAAVLRLQKIDAARDSVSNLTQQLQTHTGHTRSVQSDYADRIRGYHLQIGECESVLNQAATIEKAANELEATEAAAAQAQEAADQAAGVAMVAAAKVNELQRVESLVGPVEREGKHLNTQLASLQKRAGFISIVPCRGEGEYAECPALADAKDAASSVETVEKQLTQAREQWGKLKEQAQNLQRELLDYADAPGNLNAANDRLKRARELASDTRTLAARFSEVSRLRDTKTRLQESITAAETELGAKNHELEQAANEIRQNLDTTQQTLRTLTDQHLAQSKTEEETLRALADPDDANAATQARIYLTQAQDDLDRASQALAANIAETETAKARAEALRKQIAEGAAIRKRANKLSDETALWKLLASALAGVSDLVIEDAGPAITNTANRLLQAAYGPRFTLAIQTQRPVNVGKASERLVETFDVTVLDGESNLTSSVLDKSGGEGVWLDHALSGAVALYYQTTSGQRHGALFADEAEDGLSHERKLQFYAMDRALLDESGAKRRFFISHTPAAWNLADHTIDMETLR